MILIDDAGRGTNIPYNRLEHIRVASNPSGTHYTVAVYYKTMDGDMREMSLVTVLDMGVAARISYILNRLYAKCAVTDEHICVNVSELATPEEIAPDEATETFRKAWADASEYIAWKATAEGAVW